MEQRKSEKEKRAANLRAAILLAAAAVTAFGLWIAYSVQPLVIYEIHGTRPASSGEMEEASESGPQEVLVEKSVDLNTASQEELEKLPGIGPALAERIVRFREENGGFSDIEELADVEGIGEKKYEGVKDYIVVR